MKKKLLIIEDDPEIARLVRIHAEDLGFEVRTESDGHSGLARALELNPDLIILDLMLPSLDGNEICRDIRAARKNMPILMLTAKSEELDKVLGLELGADDYLTKPFSVKELVARIKALLRRADPARNNVSENRDIVIGDISLDPVRRRVTAGGRKIELTVKEFDLLHLFMRSPGRAYARAELLDTVWGYKFEGYDHTVNSHINRLRAKIEKDSARPRYIRTVWGVGYRFVENDEVGDPLAD